MEDIIRQKAMEYNISPLPDNPVIAMAYVPFQSWEKPYDMDAGLSRGTIFPSLDKPFIGREAASHVHD